MATWIETLPTGKSRRAVIETASARAGAGETSRTRSAAAASRTHRADFVLMTFFLASEFYAHIVGRVWLRNEDSRAAQTLMTPFRTISASSASLSFRFTTSGIGGRPARVRMASHR